MRKYCRTRSARQRRNLDDEIEPEIVNVTRRCFVVNATQIPELIECTGNSPSDRTSVISGQRKPVKSKTSPIVLFKHLDDAETRDVLAENVGTDSQVEFYRLSFAADVQSVEDGMRRHVPIDGAGMQNRGDRQSDETPRGCAN